VEVLAPLRERVPHRDWSLSSECFRWTSFSFSCCASSLPVAPLSPWWIQGALLDPKSVPLFFLSDSPLGPPPSFSLLPRFLDFVVPSKRLPGGQFRRHFCPDSLWSRPPSRILLSCASSLCRYAATLSFLPQQDLPSLCTPVSLLLSRPPGLKQGRRP